VFYYSKPFILLPKRTKTEIIQNIYRYIVKKYKEKKIVLHSKRSEYLATGTQGQNISTFFPTLRKKYSISYPYNYNSLCFTILNHFRQMLVVFKYFVGSDWRKIFQNLCTRNHCHIWSFCDDIHAYQINQCSLLNF
jgi:hypothetical protein